MRISLYSAAILFLLTSATKGEVVSWANSNGGSFSDSANWVGNVPPGNSDAASFSTGSGSNYTVGLTTPVANDNLIISDNVTLDLAGQSYGLTSTDTTNPSVQVGGNNAVLNLQSSGGPGILSSNDVILAALANQKATVNLNDPNATWDIAGSLYLGGSETAAGGLATVNIPAGTLDISGSLQNYAGSGINLNGGTLEISNTPAVTNPVNANSIVNIPGLNWSSGTLIIPSTNISFSQPTTSITLVNPGTSLSVGNITASGTTNLNIGGSLSAGRLTGAGTLNIVGNSLTLTTSTYTGAINLRSGSLQITTVTSSGAFNISGGSVSIQKYTGAGNITLTGGTFEVTQQWTDNGSVDVSGGTLIIPTGLKWTHNQPVTSTAEADHPSLPAALATIPFSGGEKIVYTWYGDANGDGVVNVADLALMAPVGTQNATWADGDFNGNHVIDTDDYTLFQIGAFYGSANISTELPEPGMMGLAVLAFVIKRRRMNCR